MSSSDAALLPTGDLAAELARRFSEAADSGAINAVDSAHLGAVFASAIRLLAAKAQEGEVPSTFAGNNTVSATDAVIACTAILESVDLAVFELAAWQAVSNIGSRQVAKAAHDRSERP